jgi:hypothetical protein
MKHLFLFFCLILCSCDLVDGTCVPIGGEGFKFNSQSGIDSIIPNDSWWHFTGVQGEEGCEVKPDAIECSWFSIVKKDSIVFASVKQNDTDRKRYGYTKIKGNGGHGECSDEWGEFTISQCPEPTDMDLSKDEFLFGSEGGIDSVIVTTNRNSWLSHPLISVRYGNIHYLYEEGFDFSGHSSVKDPWFAITDIIDGEKIILSVSKNESGKERIATLTLDPYNCGANITIIQSAE